MRSHKVEIEAQVYHYDDSGKLKNSYLYPFEWTKEDELSLALYDKDGTKIKEEIRPVRSFVQGFGKQWLNFLAGKVDTLNLYTGGSTSTSIDMVNPLAINATAGTGSFGIIAGLGSTAVTFNDTTLVTPVVQGTGLNQMEYGNTTFGSSSVVGTGSYKFTVSRSLANNSGAQITLTETGIVAKNSTNQTFLLLRDTIDSVGDPINFPVDNGQTAVITYSFYVDDRGYLTENFLKSLYGEMSLLPVNFKTTTFTAASQSLSFTEGNHLAVGHVAAAVDTWGIVVGSGSGSTPVVINSYKLLAQLPHGTTANTITYGSGSGETLVSSTGSCSIIFNRTFINLTTASTASVREIGVYIHGDAKSGGNFQDTQTDHKVCIIRIPINQIDVTTNNRLFVRCLFNLKAVN